MAAGFPRSTVFAFHAPVLQDDLGAPIFSDLVHIAERVNVPGGGKMLAKILVMSRPPEKCILSQFRRDFCGVDPQQQDDLLPRWSAEYQADTKLAQLAALTWQSVWGFSFIEAQLRECSRSSAGTCLVVEYTQLLQEPEREGWRIAEWLDSPAVAVEALGCAAAGTMDSGRKRQLADAGWNPDHSTASVTALPPRLQADVDAGKGGWPLLLGVVVGSAVRSQQAETGIAPAENVPPGGSSAVASSAALQPLAVRCKGFLMDRPWDLPR